ncbi:MAG: transglutaminase domain-containing protein [Berryella intestinalis]|uniref:transglutaminase domain-containing protein n=1 Tax=Berryella intestinalis TaxID=1531429 RepID=UPI002A5068D3|nr:transglutaminase domain-containing protein [Berryella intestinalis]MDD7369801.1 transglutaminase domain-containing protein [Berryella intestinalis]MDY3129820.1 transglutaminase domain-containing protein [Berryella intestinalis]
MRKKILASALASVVLAFTALSPVTALAAEGDAIDKLRESTDDPFTMMEGVQTIGQDEALTIPTSVKRSSVEKDANGEQKMFRLYADTNFEIELPIQIEYGFQEIVVGPNDGFGERISDDYLVGNNAVEKGGIEKTIASSAREVVGFGGWGSLPIYYLVQYNDTDTGRLLERPVVRRIRVSDDNLLPAPQHVQCTQREDGSLDVTWDPVEGAVGYKIVTMKNYPLPDSGKAELAPRLVGLSEDTSWNSDEYTPLSSEVNCVFHDSERSKGSEGSGFDAVATEALRNGPGRTLAVIAVGDNKTSYLSDPIDIEGILANVPISINETAWKKLMGGSSAALDGLASVPSTVPVLMADGRTRSYPVVFDVEHATLQGDRLGVKAAVGSSKLLCGFTVDNVDPATYKEKLEELNKEAREGLLTGAGVLEIGYPSDIGDAKIADTYPKTDVEPVGTMSLTKYLAANMMNGEEVIDVSRFPEADDPHTLRMAFEEVYGLNPMVPMFSRYSFSRARGGVVGVTYLLESKDRLNGFKESAASADDVIARIIAPGMSERDKVIAINDWIAANATYDYESNRDIVAKPDDVSDHQATGVFVEGKAVCEGYAQAFQILAQKAGLTSMVVTGEATSSNEGHAWNQVKVDGQWYSVDSTWNDTEGRRTPNRYLLLPMDDEKMSSTHSWGDPVFKSRL